MTADAAENTDPSTAVLNVAGYKFVTLDRLEERQEQLRTRCHELGLLGTILLSPEGINLFLAGDASAIDTLLAEIKEEPAFADFTVKRSYSDAMPFDRLRVRLKKEIIAFGVPGVEPAISTAPYVDPATLKSWLDEGKSLVLLDTRNDYEVSLGTFRGAIKLGLRHFRKFPQAAAKLPEELKDQTIVTFCTGGIRCEKASAWLQQQGFRDVYQLAGGILQYFEDCGSDHYDGTCFVYDQRVAVDANLQVDPDATSNYPTPKLSHRSGLPHPPAPRSDESSHP